MTFAHVYNKIQNEDNTIMWSVVSVLKALGAEVLTKKFAKHAF